jgi:tetratricopeptide (TPR) repeat protein
MTGGVDRIERVRGGEDWHLRDERDLLQRSLEDAAREHGAGDLTDEDYELLRSRDERRLAEVDAALASRPVEVAVARTRDRRPRRRDGRGEDRSAADEGGLHRRRRRRWWVAVGGVGFVVAATVVLVVELTSPRLPGEDATGSISLNTAQTVERQLSQAKTLVADGQDTEALQLYGDVLAEDPRDPVALAEWGWLDWRAASAAKQATVAAEGASALEEAVKLDPRLFAAQYYLGVVLFDEGAATKAVTHFRKFLDDKPTAKWLGDAAPDLRAAFAAAHEPVPAGVPSS